MKKARAHVIITGIFRGFFIRSAVKTKAKFLGVSGWIRSNTESETEAVFEGFREDLEEIVDFLRKGPNNVVVYNFDVKWEDATEEFRDFEIRPTTNFQVAIGQAKKAS